MDSWFVLRMFAQHLMLKGPMSFEELKEALSTGKLSFGDYVYRPETTKKWLRVYEVPELLEGLPQKPSSLEFSEFETQIVERSLPQPPPLRKKPPKQEDDQTAILHYGENWYLQFEGTEFGPFKFREAEKLIKSGKFSNGTLLIWQERLVNWLKVSAYPILDQSLAAAIQQANRMIIETGANKRASRREILPASISVKVKKFTSIGVCWDISEGGLQSYGLDADLKIGNTYPLTIMPISLLGVDDFKVHAKLLWSNEIAERMGFQFVDELEKKTVAKIIKKAAKKTP